jgi:anti-sigma regulatory factor (Ser/Thr protein kinase)
MVTQAIGAADEDVVDRATLCTSELVTNAIEHAEPPVGLSVTVDEHRVRIEVDDASDLLPTLGHPGETCIRGRGMLIVARCSDRWGVIARPGGKTVWCELRLSGAQRARRRVMASAPPR